MTAAGGVFWVGEKIQDRKVKGREVNNDATENNGSADKRILILVNHDVVIYNFRLELVQRLLSEGYEVHISSPYGERIDVLVKLGSKYHEISIDRHGMNPISDVRLIFEYIKLAKNIKPSVILSYTIKPNIYGGIAASICGIPFFTTITGLGMAIENGGLMQRLLVIMYNIALAKAEKVFLQNSENAEFFANNHIALGKHIILPGSGVNLSHFTYEQYPSDDEEIVFITVGRIMQAKGTDELIEAARMVRTKHPETVFYLIGFYDEDYQEKVERAVVEGIVKHVDQQMDVRPYYKKCHAIIHPGHHEGMSNVCLEAASSGRPILASRIHGCIETFDEGKSGISFLPKNVGDLVNTIEKFINLSFDEKAEMGKLGRKKMEEEFDREKVVDTYMRAVNSARI